MHDRAERWQSPERHLERGHGAVGGDVERQRKHRHRPCRQGTGMAADHEQGLGATRDGPASDGLPNGPEATGDEDGAGEAGPRDVGSRRQRHQTWSLHTTGAQPNPRLTIVTDELGLKRCRRRLAHKLDAAQTELGPLGRQCRGQTDGSACLLYTSPSPRD